MTRQLTIIAAVLLFAAPALAQSEVFVVHGIPGIDLGVPAELPVDISVDGACALPGFTFGTIEGPLSFEEGLYDIQIHEPNVDTPCSGEVIIDASGVEIDGGGSYSIVAHLTTDGAPTASVFRNAVFNFNDRPIVNVFHAANAPAVDAVITQRLPRRGGSVAFEDVAAGESGVVQVRAGGYTADIFAAGTSDRVFPRVRLFPEAGSSYLVFAVGSIENDTFTLLTTATTIQGTTQFSVFHGINGFDLSLPSSLAVDVNFDGTCLLPGFEFGEVVGPVQILPGNYDVAISVANVDSPCSNAPIITANDVPFEAFSNLVVVAHLDETGAPTVTPFEISQTAGPDVSRINILHAAAAPAVDVFFGSVNRGEKFGNGVENSGSVDFRVRPSQNQFAVTAAGDPSTRVVGPASLALEGGASYVVIAVGTLGTTFQLFVLGYTGI